MKCGCQRGAKNKTEKQSGPDANDARENSEKNCTDREFIYRRSHTNIRVYLCSTSKAKPFATDLFAANLDSEQRCRPKLAIDKYWPFAAV